MSALIHERKSLIKQTQQYPALKNTLEIQIAEIDQKLAAKVNQSDQNYLRVFYRIAKENLPNEVFEHLHNIASTRVHNQSQKKK